MIKELIEIAIEAGNAIQEVAASSFDITIKKDNTPVTDADMAAHNLIAKALEEKFPEIPLLSEENCEIPVETRQSWKKYFLVDPLDGTKGFIKQDKNYAVLISLMENNRPTMGIVHAPVSKETWYAIKGKGAFKIEPNGEERKISVTAPPGKIRVAISANHLTQVTNDYLEANFKEFETHPFGSAIKFCKIAEGLLDIYPRLGPTSEWDSSAGEIILEEAGGGVVQYENRKPLEYNKDSLRNPWFIAYGTELDKLN